ncbi:MAG: hypothetical protein PHH14_04430 [Candidatus Margulisbacteria bacterium]|nr:hypothetical protein [Candidatus Margulisiibacteriota bacterium]
MIAAKKLDSVMINALTRAGYIPCPLLSDENRAGALRIKCWVKGERGPIPQTATIPRWMVLGKVGKDLKTTDDIKRAESSFLMDQFGLGGEIDSLTATDKRMILEAQVPPEVAQSGVSFSEAFGQFSKEHIEEFRRANDNDYNVHDLTISFELQGVVRQCGTRGFINRLVKLVDPETEVSFGASEQHVTLNKTNLFAYYALRGFLVPAVVNPESPTYLPRIYHVADLGWSLADYNFVIYPGMGKIVRLPMATHIYTINISGITGVSDSLDDKIKKSADRFLIKMGASEMEHKVKRFLKLLSGNLSIRPGR